MRTLIAFPCEGDTLLGTLDDATGTTGLLIVSGGNELRIGAHRGMAMLAARVADELATPVFRYDRRGIGDSTGENRGFEHSAQDIAAAAAAFRRAAPQLRRIVALGNCDAASALALFHAGAGIDALILANPWTIETADTLPPAAAIRARYAQRLRDPRAWLRLLRGGVNLIKLAQGLRKISATPPPAPAGLASRLGAALEASDAPTTILLASGDNTAIAFREAWQGDAFTAARARITPVSCETTSHSFARAEDKHWLFTQIAKHLTSPPCKGIVDYRLIG